MLTEWVDGDIIIAIIGITVTPRRGFISCLVELDVWNGSGYGILKYHLPFVKSAFAKSASRKYIVSIFKHLFLFSIFLFFFF